MVSFLRDLIAVTIVLGVMIFVHEWGHFIAAKFCGVRVDVFSFGFGTRLCGVKRGDTDYRLSALPFGGYVRMAGDNVIEERTGADYEYLSKSRWQRVMIAVAGPFMNVLLAFFIFWGIYSIVGMPMDTDLQKPADVVALPAAPAAASGIQVGDRILSVDGVNTPTWDKVLTEVSESAPGNTLSVIVLRSGAKQTLRIPIPAHTISADTLVGYPPLSTTVEDVEIGFPAEKAGMKPGDKIISIDGKPIVTWDQLVDAVYGSGGRSIDFVVLRNGRQIPLSIAPMQGMTPDGRTVWQIGVVRKSNQVYQREGLVTAVKDAGLETYLNMRQIVEVVGGLFSGKVSIRELQGVVGIARVSGQAAKRGPVTLLGLMAVISLNLGLLNLFPIPVLDGGHVLLLAIEGVLRRDLSIALKERFVQVGLVFILGIFAFVMYSDILKLIQSH
ncbi:MAG TPA: RIP metalloprotease RseP [Candidatus Acidoferrales bacterium]|nr:RIP metalloprotease RseP [Candidatus Acidoferrales bacterium]